MSWKSVAVVIAMLAFSTSLMAQKKDPFLGIWEMNLEKTTNPAAMASQTIINTPTADGFTSTRAFVEKDGKGHPTEIHPVAFDGKPLKTLGGDPREIAYKRIDEYTIERTTNRGGRTSVDQEQVSKDGKTMTVTTQAGVTVYTKEFDVAPAKH